MRWHIPSRWWWGWWWWLLIYFRLLVTLGRLGCAQTYLNVFVLLTWLKLIFLESLNNPFQNIKINFFQPFLWLIFKAEVSRHVYHKCCLWGLSEVHVFIAPEVELCLLSDLEASTLSYWYQDKDRHQHAELSGLAKWPLTFCINTIIMVCSFALLEAWPAVTWDEKKCNLKRC